MAGGIAPRHDRAMDEETYDPEELAASDALTTTLTVDRLDGGPRLVIEAADLVVYQSLAGDSGARAFDAWTADPSHERDQYRITEADIVAINRLGARSPHSVWAALTETGELPWLRTLPVGADLLAIDDERWSGISPLVATALARAIGPRRNLATATKLLHAKRPGLFPVLDRLVVEQIGGSRTPPLELIDHLRRVGRANRLPLGLIGANLEKVHLELTAVRLLDAALWATHPAAGAMPRLGGWGRRFELGIEQANEAPPPETVINSCFGARERPTEAGLGC